MKDTLTELLAVQEKLIEQTKLETEAKLQVVAVTKELINKQEEFIRINSKIDDSISKIEQSISNLITTLPKIDTIDDKLQSMIVILQILVSVLANLNGVSKEITDKLQNHVLRLAELSVVKSTINNFENFNANKSQVGFNDVPKQ